jgi:hypothetical protein
MPLTVTKSYKKLLTHLILWLSWFKGKLQCWGLNIATYFFTFGLFSWFSVESVGVSCTKENYFQYNSIKNVLNFFSFFLRQVKRTIFISIFYRQFWKKEFSEYLAQFEVGKTSVFLLVNKDKIPNRLNWNRRGLLNWNISVDYLSFLDLKKIQFSL